MGLTEVVAGDSSNSGIKKVGSRVKGVYHSRGSSTASSSSDNSSLADDSSWVPAVSSLGYPNSTDPLSELALNPKTLEDGENVTVDSLERELDETRQQLERSQVEVERLGRIRDDVEAEVRELTASLFQEAHAMVREANVKAAAAEKALTEARMQMDVLQAEVNALKTLVITSTPSQPNAHLHPQLSSSNSTSPSTPPKSNGLKMFTRHRRGASDDLKLNGLVLDAGVTVDVVDGSVSEREVDPVFFEEFEEWRRNPVLTKDSLFVERIFNEDADRCLDFPNSDLSLKVRKAVESNCVYIEECNNQLPMRCELLNTQRLCRYRMKLGDCDVWYSVSPLCRNRITAVCDILTYLRYIQLGLVKSPTTDVYWEIIRLRKQMTLARLGLV